MTEPAQHRRGNPSQGGRVPSPRPWRERLDDPDEPLYTVAVAAELLGVDTQAVRRLQEAALHPTARPSGNQRRYSRRDLEILAAAAELSRDGMNATAIGRILELERQVHSQDRQ